MMPSTEGPGLRDRIHVALDELTWDERVESLIVLMDDYSAEQAEIAYRQGRESGKRTGREDVLHALSNFVVAQELEALDELSPTCRRHMMRTIDLLRALIEIEEVRP